MEQLLRSLGLNENEIKAYLVLLKSRSLSAAEIAKKSGESRTNTYAIMEKLVNFGIVEVDETKPVKEFRSAHPGKLRDLLEKKRTDLVGAETQLNSALPSLVSMYNLAQSKPGIFHYEGLDGYKKLLNDMSESGSDIWLLPSKNPPKDGQVDQILKRGLAKRRARNIRTRALMPLVAKNWSNLEKFKSQNFELKFIGEAVNAEIISYENKIAFTVYEPKLITTIITDDQLAQSLQMMFEQMWCFAEQD